MDLAYANAKVPSLANVKSHADDLDDYLERLYDDDMNTRVSATAHIAALARRVENLPVLLGHDTLVQTLARVLREEGRCLLYTSDAADDWILILKFTHPLIQRISLARREIPHVGA